MPDCSIVIRCYNEEKHIARLLSGILEQTVKDVEIIIVDSGSTDATLSIASRYPVKVLSIRAEEFSFGRSLNLGCRGANGEFIVIASAHVYPVYNDWLENLLAPFKDSDVALVYGKQRGDGKARYSEQQIYKRWYPEDSATHKRFPFCNNANAAIRRYVWEKLPYDEDITGLEDLDWAKRAIEQGCKIVYNAEAEIIHVHNEDYQQIYNRYRREAIAFKHIYPHESFHIWDFLRLFATNVVTDYFHAWHDGVFVKNLAAIPGFRFMQFLGTYRGFAKHGLITGRLRNRFYYPKGLKPREGVAPNNQEKRRINYEHH
jgi:glycosyltransferase involved in cell wall biosynthesis